MKRFKNAIYLFGVCLSFLAIAGVAESITGRGNRMISVVLLIIGFICALVGYM